jgi:TRAP-type C4-dicarboxylate transport system substrate-binding protein
MQRIARLVAALIAGAWASAAAAETRPIELRYATVAPPKTPWVMQLERLARDLEDESRGTMKIQPHINAQLGYEAETLQQTAKARIDMGSFSTQAAATLAPELSLLNLPFYFDNPQQQDCLLDHYAADIVRGALARRGVAFLGWTQVGAIDIVGKQPFPLPSEVRGLKARSTPTKADAAFWTTLGATPVPLAANDWAPAFEAGQIDVAAAPITYYFPSGLGRVAPVMTRTGHVDLAGIIAMSKPVYDRLTADQRNILQRAILKRPASQLRAEVRGFEDAIRQMHIKGGGQIVTLSPPQRAAWRKTFEATWPLALKSAGADGERLWKTIEDGRKSCSGRVA